MNVSDLITAGEALYTEIAGKNVSTKAVDNINDIGSVVSLIVSLTARNITSVDVNGIVDGVGEVVTGITSIVKAAKTTTVTTTTSAVTAS